MLPDAGLRSVAAGWVSVPLEEVGATAARPLEDLIALSRALDELERIDERQARVVECRFFGGLSLEETAEALGISPATVSRDWTFARAWLHRAVGVEADPPQP